MKTSTVLSLRPDLEMRSGRLIPTSTAVVQVYNEARRPSGVHWTDYRSTVKRPVPTDLNPSSQCVLYRTQEPDQRERVNTVLLVAAARRRGQIQSGGLWQGMVRRSISESQHAKRDQRGDGLVRQDK